MGLFQIMIAENTPPISYYDEKLLYSLHRCLK